MAAKTNQQQHPIRVGLVSLGCAKNLVDAEVIVGSLIRSGFEITNDAASADILIINTCSFIDAAQEESVDAILESAQARKKGNRSQALIVSGCLPQRFRDDLPGLLPEVDAFMGIDQITQVSEIAKAALARRAQRLAQRPGRQSPKQRVLGKLNKVERDSHSDGKRFQSGPISEAPLFEVNSRPTFIPDFATPRFRLTPQHFAYVKIAEGCNHPCSFCVIPRIRGSHRSRPQADIVAEACRFIADGVKELNLISQDSTRYGLDLHQSRKLRPGVPGQQLDAGAQATNICSLLRELNAIEGDFWIRLLYTHPAHWTDELIQTIADCRKVVRYVDIPLQHIHEQMLQRMRRETSPQHIVDLIRKIRAGIPGIAIRTAFIVGFPGETAQHFKTLLDFIREMRFERLGVFAYSQEEGTVAGRMSGQVPDALKQKRRGLAMAVQREIARRVSKSFVGRELRVLVEKTASARDLRQANIRSWEHGFSRSAPAQPLAFKGFVARTEADAPDIDGRVYVRGNARAGDFANVRVIGSTDYDLLAEPVS